MSTSPPMSIHPALPSGSCRGSARVKLASARATSRLEGVLVQLAGKKVVVVGGSSGIGLSTAELAKREGADVIVASRSAAKLDRVAERLNAIAITTDVTDDKSVANLFRNAGSIDHVVVTAAQLRTGPFKTVPMEDVRATMEGKFWGAWRVAREAEIRTGGSLTLVSGFLSKRPRPN